jgi:hypothetical protein
MYVYTMRQRIYDIVVAVLFTLVPMLFVYASVAGYRSPWYYYVSCAFYVAIAVVRIRLAVRRTLLARKVPSELREQYAEFLLRLTRVVDPSIGFVAMRHPEDRRSVTIARTLWGDTTITLNDGTESDWGESEQRFDIVYRFDMPATVGYVKRRCTLSPSHEQFVRFPAHGSGSVTVPAACEALDLDDVKQLYDAIATWPIEQQHRTSS